MIIASFFLVFYVFFFFLFLSFLSFYYEGGVDCFRKYKCYDHSCPFSFEKLFAVWFVTQYVYVLSLCVVVYFCAGTLRVSVQFVFNNASSHKNQLQRNRW